MNILLLNDNGYINNFGCQATMAVLRRMIQDAAPSCQISTIRQDVMAQDFTVQYGQTSLKEKVKQTIQGSSNSKQRIVKCFPAIANEFTDYARQWETGKVSMAADLFLPQLESADLIIHNAELLNYKDNKISRRGAFLTWYAKKYLGKMAAMINQTTPAPSSDLIMEGILEFVSPNFDLVTAREPRSQRLLESIGVKSNLVPDPVFSMEPNFSSEQRVMSWCESVGISRPYVCLSFISVLANQVGKKNSINKLVQVIELISEGGFDVVLLDAGSGGLRAINDILVANTNAKMFMGDHIDFWSLLRRSSFLISGHYHNIIMAAKLGRPFIPFRSVSHKVEGLCELLDWKFPILNPTCLDIHLNTIKSHIEQIQNNYDAMSEHLISRCLNLQEEAKKTQFLIHDLVMNCSTL